MDGDVMVGNRAWSLQGRRPRQRGGAGAWPPVLAVCSRL